ncbi:hypothetical protein GCM10020256_32590 [Streptomyces thermocoprophilus]
MQQVPGGTLGVGRYGAVGGAGGEGLGEGFVGAVMAVPILPRGGTRACVATGRGAAKRPGGGAGTRRGWWGATQGREGRDGREAEEGGPGPMGEARGAGQGPTRWR